MADKNAMKNKSAMRNKSKVKNKDIGDFPTKNNSKKSRSMSGKMSANFAEYCRSLGWNIPIITATKCMRYLI